MEEPWQQQYELSGTGYYAGTSHGYIPASPAAAAQPPVFCTDGQLTFASSPSKSNGHRPDYTSPGSHGSTAGYAAQSSPQRQPRRHQQRLTPAASEAAYTHHQLELLNAQLMRQCQELQVGPAEALYFTLKTFHRDCFVDIVAV
jgi:hypothetical protein